MSKAIYFNSIVQGAKRKSYAHIFSHNVLKNSHTISDADDLVLPSKSFGKQVVSWSKLKLFHNTYFVVAL